MRRTPQNSPSALLGQTLGSGDGTAVSAGSAPPGEGGRRPRAGARARSGSPAAPDAPAVPAQRLPRRPGERREAHVGRALGAVGPSMLLCSASEAICFFMGEPAPRPPTGAAGLGAAAPWLCGTAAPRPESQVCPPRRPDPHARRKDLCADLRRRGDPRLPAAGVGLRGPALARRPQAGGGGPARAPSWRGRVASRGRGGWERGRGQEHCAAVFRPRSPQCPTEKQFLFGHYGECNHTS